MRRTPWGPRPEVTAVTSSPPLKATGSRDSPGPLCFPNPRRSGGRVPYTSGTRSPGGTRVSSGAASPLRGIDGPLAPPAGRPSPPSILAGVAGRGWGEEEEEAWWRAQPTSPSPIFNPQPPPRASIDAPTPPRTYAPLQPSHSRLSPSTGDGSPPGTTPRNSQQGNKGASENFKCLEGVCFSP